jgi:hypothetical protein
LRARADVGDRYARRLLAYLLRERGDRDGAEQVLRAQAEAGDQDAPRRLADLLKERGDLDGLRALAAVGVDYAANLLDLLLFEQGRGEEAERLRRFGLNPDGSIASA